MVCSYDSCTIPTLRVQFRYNPWICFSVHVSSAWNSLLRNTWTTATGLDARNIRIWCLHCTLCLADCFDNSIRINWIHLDHSDAYGTTRIWNVFADHFLSTDGTTENATKNRCCSNSSR
ncbi:unnamed protein product [Anisakis simplex]|uniref:Secreted protein n=1 Tax=Anisakis simplex TaxID=6269 RepID=A0A0M3KEB6_ANISI|nr:unnamed protein product [Anisakis simplex]